MTLPKIDVPTYDVIVPSTGKEIQIRPFLVKEEKLLLMAVESKDNENIIKTTKHVINNCIVSGKLDLEKIPFFDVDYLFIALRAKSVGEKIEVSYKCNNLVEGQICNGVFNVDVDIAKCKIQEKEGIKDLIKLSGTLSVKMKYPSYSIMKLISGNENVIEKKIRVMINSVDKIINGDKVYTTKDFTKEELRGFIEGLTNEQYKKLEEFIDNFPEFYIEAKGVCGKCGSNHDVRYTDFTRFFQ
jgi:hypothetical protein